MKTNERKKPVILGVIILIVLVTAGLITGFFLLSDAVNFVSTDDAAIDSDHAAVSPKMLGRIRTLLASERDKVKAGQLLVELDSDDLKAQEVQAVASMKYAKQNLNLARVSLDRARDDFQRTKSLFDSGVSTREQYTHASKTLETAEAQYSIAQAQIETSKAQLGIIETQLGNTKIMAPISGVIAKKLFMPGDIVQAGQSIYLINDLDFLWVTANFEETKVSHIRLGAEAEIYIDAYPGRPFKGRVTRIAAGIVSPPFSIGEFTKTTQRVPVRIEFDKIPESLIILPGMSVEVKIKVK